MAFSFEPGTIIDGTYRVIEPLGSGGMAIVLRAYDARLERDVAIKLIRPELLDSAFRERFLSEARAMARVCHPNVLPIYAFGEHTFDGGERAPYLVTQVVRGPSVANWLEARPAGTAPDLEIAFRILEETCRGVAAIHAAETVHRDLKPSNLLLDGSFGVRVADLGLAALLRTIGGDHQPELVGTPEYMAPEVVLQSDVPPHLASRADVYALGCLAFALFTGSAPFVRKGAIAGMLAHVETPPPRLTERRPDLPAALDDVVRAALRKDPEERTSSAEAFCRALVAVRTMTYNPVRILLAEDDDDFRELLAMTLQEEFPDAMLECVSDGRAALEAFDLHQHSAVIVDLRMPKLNGLELTELLRSRPAALHVPILVLTGSGGPTEWRRLSEIGADGFLVKPVNVKDVSTLLRRTLAERTRSTPPPDPSSRTSRVETKTVKEGAGEIASALALTAERQRA